MEKVLLNYHLRQRHKRENSIRLLYANEETRTSRDCKYSKRNEWLSPQHCHGAEATYRTADPWVSSSIPGLDKAFSDQRGRAGNSCARGRKLEANAFMHPRTTLVVTVRRAD